PRHGLFALVPPRLTLLAALDVDRREALELQRLALGAEQPPPRLDVCGDRVVDGRHELTRQETLPDQAVERELVLGEEARHGFRIARDVRGTDGLVRLLRAAPRLVARWRVGQGLGADTLRRPASRLGLRVLREARGVGPHVGDQTDGAYFAEVPTLVELLGHGHRLLRREAELTARVLL